MSDDLAKAAAAAMRCLAVAADDDVLVLMNEETRAVAESLALAAGDRGRSVRLVIYPALTRDGEEPPASVAQAMVEATVIFAPTVFSLSHTQARGEATRRGARIATMPGVTEALFERAIPVDYAELERLGGQIAGRLGGANACTVSSPAGTDIVLSLEGRTGISDDGNMRTRAAWGNLPAGEAFIAPIESIGEGSIAFDGALAGYGRLGDPLRLTLREGRVVAAEGEGSEWLLETLDAAGPTGRVIAELGIGTNRGATLTGNILEDEKVFGTAHIAFGTSTSIGGSNLSSVHIDGMLLQPTVDLDGHLLIRDGQPAFE